MTSEPEGPAPEARVEGLEKKAPAARIVRALKPANEAAPPPPPEPANSDVAGDAGAGPGAAQEWPLAWLRVVEPEPPTADDEVVAAVIAAEPADADGIAHAFGRLMAAAVDPDPVFESEDAGEPAGRAYYSVPVGDPPDAPTGEAEGPSPAGEDARAEAAEQTPAAEAQENAAAEPEPALVTPVYVSRRSGARQAAAKAAPKSAAPADGKAGEGAPAMAAYLFCLAGFLLVPAVAGVAIAYNARRSAPAWLQSHYLFLIRTFWIGLAGTAVAAALLFSGRLTLAGLVLSFFLVVWIEVRSALGFISLVKLRAFPRPRSWLF